jgi:nitronate monooxygenase
MALRTALTEMFGIDHPVVLAPMGDVAGGALAAAVSEGGGLGVIGGGRGDLTWLARECDLARTGTDKPWGIGFLSWGIGPAAVDAAVAQSPAAIMLSFGDPVDYLPIWAGEAVDMITAAEGAAELVGLIARGAEQALATAGVRHD